MLISYSAGCGMWYQRIRETMRDSPEFESGPTPVVPKSQMQLSTKKRRYDDMEADDDPRHFRRVRMRCWDREPGIMSFHRSLNTNGIVPSEELVPAENESEDYTIKCICSFQHDDGNTVYCDLCKTWQHIECYYIDKHGIIPTNADLSTRDHWCVDCQPRRLDTKGAIERQKHRRARVTSSATGHSQWDVPVRSPDIKRLRDLNSDYEKVANLEQPRRDQDAEQEAREAAYEKETRDAPVQEGTLTASIEDVKDATMEDDPAHYGDSFASGASEDWRQISDIAERRRTQNRIAHRNYRES